MFRWRHWRETLRQFEHLREQSPELAALLDHMDRANRQQMRQAVMLTIVSLIIGWLMSAFVPAVGLIPMIVHF